MHVIYSLFKHTFFVNNKHSTHPSTSLFQIGGVQDGQTGLVEEGKLPPQSFIFATFPSKLVHLTVVLFPQQGLVDSCFLLNNE